MAPEQTTGPKKMKSHGTRTSEDSEIARRRKEQVLSAAVECFRRNGFHRSSMAQISAAAGMSSGHIYHYFKSKEEIIAAIVRRERDEINLMIEDAKASGKDPDIVFFVDQLARAVALHNDVSRASLTMDILAEASRNPEIAKVVQQNNAEVHDALFKLFKTQDPKIHSRMEIIGALMAGLSVRTLRNPNLKQDLDLDMLRDVICYILPVSEQAVPAGTARD